MNEGLEDLSEEMYSFSWPEPTSDALHSWFWASNLSSYVENELFDQWLHSMESSF